MTGPEHYREAERLLEDANDQPWSSRADYCIAKATAHATLALAAATALTPGVSPGDALAWLDAAGGEQP